MSELFMQLLNNPPRISVKKDAREVIIQTRSAMCDNIGRLVFKKNVEGDFTVHGSGNALSNWQMKGDYRTDLTWSADDGDWDKVVRVINTGTHRFESARSR